MTDISSMSLSEKKKLASSLRTQIIEAVKQNGGHLSSNLGIIETSIELVSCFDCYIDSILFDVGHQTYAYKILTGRDISQIRKYKGIGPFSLRAESPYDKYDNGHSGDALPTAIGMAIADSTIDDKSYKVVVVGDASFDNGLSQESLRILGERKNLKNLILLVNKNGMAIKKMKDDDSLKDDVLRENWFKEREDFKGDEISWEKIIETRLEVTKKENNIYSIHGLNYLGKVDGHDFISLKYAFGKAKKETLNGPVVIEILTRKGMGLEEAEKDEIGLYHSLSSQNKDSRDLDYSKAKSELIMSLMKKDENVYVLTPAMELNSGLYDIFKSYSERTIDVGIAEEAAVTIASGLALRGKKCIIDIYSTFFQRTIDETLMNISRQSLSVLFLIDRASLVGPDGASHHGIFDVSLIRSIPNSKVYMPVDSSSLRYIFENHAFQDGKSVFFRFPKENMVKDLNLNLTKPYIFLNENSKSDVLHIAIGPKGYNALLNDESNADKLLLIDLLLDDVDFMKDYNEIKLVDPYSIDEGTSSYLKSKLTELGFKGRFSSLTLPKRFITFGDNSYLYEECNLSDENIHDFLTESCCKA